MKAQKSQLKKNSFHFNKRATYFKPVHKLHLPAALVLLLCSILSCSKVTVEEELTNPSLQLKAASPNLTLNPGFEAAGDWQVITDWLEWSPKNQHQDASYLANFGYTGSKAGTHWKNVAYEVYTYQNLTGLNNGLYTISAWVLSSGGQTTAMLNAKEYGGTNLGYNITATSTWKQIVISNINVTNNKLTFGFYSISTAGKWMNFDDVQVFKQADLYPNGVPGEWTKVFADEFSGTTLNAANWTPNWVVTSNGDPTKVEITVPVWHGGNEEWAAYDPQRAFVSSGNLNLSVITSPVTVNGMAYTYRSGMVQSMNKRWFTYGAFEARMYLPAHSTTQIANWPSFWCNGSQAGGTWPKDGELDIMEGIDGNAHIAFHSVDPNDWQDPLKSMFVLGNYTGWHTFGACWKPGEVKYYYDGILVGTISKEITSEPMYLLLMYAIGGNGGDSTFKNNVSLLVDYVRVWQ